MKRLTQVAGPLALPPQQLEKSFYQRQVKFVFSWKADGFAVEIVLANAVQLEEDLRDSPVAVGNLLLPADASAEQESTTRPGVSNILIKPPFARYLEHIHEVPVQIMRCGFQLVVFGGFGRELQMLELQCLQTCIRRDEMHL